jgi:hypothetical protein
MDGCTGSPPCDAWSEEELLDQDELERLNNEDQESELALPDFHEQIDEQFNLQSPEPPTYPWEEDENQGQ